MLDLSLKELATLLRQKKISSEELVKEAHATATQVERLHGFTTLRDLDVLVKEARKSDEQRTEVVGELFGIPFSLKDAYETAGTTTTAGSAVLADFVPPFSATVYEKMQQAGAILVGKNSMDAWGHGGSTENTDFPIGKNPWDESRIPGGSSGGSAIAVATRSVAFAVGEDTGGSIRNPAGMCNVCGLKVTYGRVSRFGAIAYASSLDSVGPMAKSVEDLALVLEQMVGSDVKDGTSSQRAGGGYEKNLIGDLRGKIIGLPVEFFGAGLDPEVKILLHTAAKTYESLGARVVEVSIPYLKYGVSLYYLTALSETSSNLARYDGVRFGQDRNAFTEETQRRIMLGTYALSAGYADEMYKKAQKARTILIEDFKKAFAQCDVLLAPVTPSPAAKIGELINDPLKSFLEDLCTGPINLVGVPSLALPAGFTTAGLPVGMQLIGQKFAEGQLLQFGHTYQQLTNWHTRRPSTVA